MIRRKVEVALIVLGMVFFAFLAVSGVSMIMIHNDPEVATEMYEEFQVEMPAEEIPIYEEFVDSLFTNGVMVIVIGVIAVLAGGFGIFLFKGNKQPKPAAILLLMTGGLVGFLQFGIAIFGSVFYVISGLMGLLRKPKQEV
ncbi:Protein of unknown function [Pelagirhabdus alkalitolerans]|uniref:DUF4064 domain-containing protein n=1 Tax=Pelagirhabdus alkalitolerans TaxID=1612202 RepID=A0A1G6JK11_9BACI|nr:DUF4064 domain-containing protein [Pelagirhabdus alkalitolerans]SDC19090.1 Protein of unknown function [Pelagirhabdus alkalitolerans]